MNEKPYSLNGAWSPVKQEMAGAPLPAAAFKDQTLTLSDDTYVVATQGGVDKGAVTYGRGKMDIYGKEGVNAGKHFNAIYKLENGQLSICYNLAGDGYPEAFATDGKPMYLLLVFTKH